MIRSYCTSSPASWANVANDSEISSDEPITLPISVRTPRAACSRASDCWALLRRYICAFSSSTSSTIRPDPPPIRSTSRWRAAAPPSISASGLPEPVAASSPRLRGNPSAPAASPAFQPHNTAMTMTGSTTSDSTPLPTLSSSARNTAR